MADTSCKLQSRIGDDNWSTLVRVTAGKLATNGSVSLGDRRLALAVWSATWSWEHTYRFTDCGDGRSYLVERVV